MIKIKNNIYNVYTKNKEIFNYIIVGVLTTIVSLLSYYIVVLTFLNPNKSIELQTANVISWVCAVSFAYFANRIIVFKSKEKNILKEAGNFMTSRLITLFLDMFTMFLIVTILKLNDKIAKFIAQIIVLFGNYIISKLYVFKK